MLAEFPHPQVTVVICTLNEEGNLCHVLPKIPAWVDEVLLVDGHSRDKTVDMARKIRPDIRVLYQPEIGKGDALRCGFEHASGDIVVTLDADGATDPEEMPKFTKPLLEGYEFAKGSRFSIRLPAKKPAHRMFGNLLIAALFNILYFSRFTDVCSGYNAFWKKALNGIDLGGDCFEDEPLLVAKVKKARLSIAEVGHCDLGRMYGEGNSPSWRQGFKAIKSIVRERLHNL